MTGFFVGTLCAYDVWVFLFSVMTMVLFISIRILPVTFLLFMDVYLLTQAFTYTLLDYFSLIKDTFSKFQIHYQNISIPGG